MTDLECAEHPNTSAADLELLALRGSHRVREIVARNPNTPEKVLERLVVHHAKAVLENPLLTFLRFENPAWFSELPFHVRLALLKTPVCPVAWLELAGRSETDLQLAALTNPLFPAPLMQEWLGMSLDVRVLDAMAGHVENQQPLSVLAWSELDRNTELLKDVVASGLPLEPEIMAVLATDYDPELRMHLAKRTDLPLHLLEQLALDEDESVQAAIPPERVPAIAVSALALELNRPKDISRLAKGQPKARRLAAQHPTVSANILKQLAKDEDWRVRQDVARHPKTPPQVLAHLAKDHDRDVRESVANNPSSTSSTLERLLADSHDTVAKAARANPNAPKETLRLLERLEQKDLTLTQLELISAWLAPLVAAHPNVTSVLLETFAKSEFSDVRKAVAQNPQTPQRLLEPLTQDADTDVVMALLKRPSLPENLMLHLVLHPDSQVVEALSLHSGLSKRLLTELSQHSQWQVRRNIAAHPRCPHECLERLSQDTDADVRESAVCNPNANALVALHGLGVELRLPQLRLQLEAHDPSLSSSWLEFLVRRGNDLAKRWAASHPNLGLDVMTWLLTHDWKIRVELVKNPSLPLVLLERLSLDDDRDVRCAVAEKPSTPIDILQLLAADSDSTVRRVVALRGIAHDALCWDDDPTVLECVSEAHLVLRKKLEAGAELEPSQLLRLLDSNNPFVMQHLPKHVYIPELEKWLCHEAWQVRQAAARNHFCTPAQLVQLLADQDRDVRLEVAKHRNTTPEMLAMLMRDPDILVRRAALGNPFLEPSLRQTAQRYILDECLRSSSLNRIIALKRTTRIAELKKRRNYLSLEWRERRSVAENPHTPSQILEQLCQDANRLVRAVAQARLKGKS